MALDGARKQARPVGSFADLGRFPTDSAIVPDGPLGSELEMADRALCRLEGAVSALPDASVYAEMHLRCEATRSSVLSGYSAALTSLLPEKASPASASGASPPGAAARCLQAMQAALSKPPDDPLSLDALREAQGILCSPESEAAGLDSEPRAEASGPEDSPAARLRDLWEEALATSEGHARLPALARIGMAQARIESARPFPAGNGRMARILVPLLLNRQRGLTLGISGFLLAHAAEYSRLAQSGAASEGGEAWLKFFLRGVAESAAGSADEIRRVTALREEHRDAVTASLGHAVGRGLRVLHRLGRKPLATVADVRAITGTSYVAANLLVSRFTDLGILEEVTGYRRNRVFLYGPYVRLFETDSHAMGTVAELAPVRSVKVRAGRARAGKPRSKAPGRSAPEQAPLESKASQPKPGSEAPRRRLPTLSDHLL